MRTSEFVIPCGRETYYNAIPMTRQGKIARLPREMRDELNVRLRCASTRQVRLHNREQELAQWLNGLPGAQAVLGEKFGGRPISAQDLWKKGGYEDWLQEKRAYAAMLTEMSRDLEEEAGEAVGNAEWEPPRKPRVCDETKARIARPHPNPLPQERELTSAAPGKSHKRHTAEAPIKVNQTKSNRGGDGSGQWPVVSGEWQVLHTRYPPRSNPVKASQTRSNQIKPNQTDTISKVIQPAARRARGSSPQPTVNNFYEKAFYTSENCLPQAKFDATNVPVFKNQAT